MTSRSIRAALGLAALTLAAALPAVAQSVETRGVVQRVDVASGTVYFTDGRTVRLEPGSRLTVDGRPVSLADVQPGWTLVVPGVAATAAPSVAIATPPPARPVTAPVDATGVVSRVDPQTGTVVLEDGRVLQATGRTTIWQPVPLNALKPGTSVHMRNAEALDFRPSGGVAPSGTAAPAGSSRFSMGTVSRVDPTAGTLLLSDGTVIPLTPGTRVDMYGRTLTVTDLRPGDEVVIGGALPGAALVTTPLEIHIVRRPQAP